MPPWRSRWSGAMLISTAMSNSTRLVEQVELVGRQFEDIDAVGRPAGIRPSAGMPRLPPVSTRRPAAASIWPSSAVVVDLPLVPVMPMKRASFWLRDSSSMSPTNRAPGLPCARATTGCGCRMGQRDSRAQDHGRGALQRRLVGPADRRAPHSGGGLAAGRLAVVPGPDAGRRPASGPWRSPGRICPARRRRRCDRRSGIPRSSPPHRSFSVDRPISARMVAMIQNRMTMVDSAQPFFSK